MGVKVSEGSGNFYRPANGMYVLEFVGVEDGEQPAYDDKSKMEPCWNVSFKVGKFPNNEPVIDDKTGQQAVYVRSISRSLNTRSNGYKYLRSLLNRDPAVGEDSDDLWAEAQGKKCIGQFDKNQAGKDGSLVATMPFTGVFGG